MPNWCENTLHVSGDEQLIKKFKEQVRGEGTALSFASLVPMPKELKGLSSSPKIVSEKEYDEAVKKAKKEAKKNSMIGLCLPITRKMKKDLMERFGALHWYDWNIKNWGTKWDVNASLDCEEKNDLTYFFATAWSPPEAWLRKVSERFLNLKFVMIYDEPGMGFKGTMEVMAGELNDNCLSQ